MAAGEPGYGNVVCADIVAAPHPGITCGRWDYLLLLPRLRGSIYAGSVDGLPITISNVFFLDNRR